MTFENTINSAGVSLILLAFFLLTLNKLKPEDKTYNLLNLALTYLVLIGRRPTELRIRLRS